MNNSENDVKNPSEMFATEAGKNGENVEIAQKSDAENSDEKLQDFDIFAWANHVAAAKNELDAEFFLVNKRYTVYHLPIASELKPQIAPVFFLEILNEIEKGAGLGLEICEYEDSESEPGVLLFSTTKKVANAANVLDQIENQRREIENFNEYDHEFKTIKMIVAKFSHKNLEPFYIVKQVAGSSSLSERNAWEISENGKMQNFNAAVAFKIPTDNQMLIAGGRIFAFSPKKFEAAFSYNYKKQAIADKKVEQILQKYQLNFPEGQDLNTLIAGRTKTIAKLQNLEIGRKSQEEIVDYCEEMALDLMTADDGAIIIMDGRDVDTFVGLLNDDFMTSDLTGLKYEVKAKKLLGE